MTAQEARNLMPKYNMTLEKRIKIIENEIASEAKKNNDSITTIVYVDTEDESEFYKVYDGIKDWLSNNGYTYIIKSNDKAISYYISWRD